MASALSERKRPFTLTEMKRAPSRNRQLSHLLERARRPSFRVWAADARFEQKDVLKRRGYRWSAGEDGRPRAWWIDVAEAAREPEIEWLQAQV